MELQCWKCGEALEGIILPFSRREECSHCNADQHVCLLCTEYDAAVSDACREGRADFVLDKDKANFCDFFKPHPDAYQKKDASQETEARARLAELFGDEQGAATGDAGANISLTESEKALEELKRLFDD